MIQQFHSWVYMQRWKTLIQKDTCIPMFISSVHSFSLVQLADPLDRSAAGLPVRHQFLEFAQTHVHRVGDAIHPILCHPLLLPPSIFPSSRPPCPSPTPGVCSDSCPLSRRCHPSYPVSSPSPSTFNLSQHQGLFKMLTAPGKYHSTFCLSEFTLHLCKWNQKVFLTLWLALLPSNNNFEFHPCCNMCQNSLLF